MSICALAELALVAACAADGSHGEPLECAPAAVIYGHDDRNEPAHVAAPWRDLGSAFAIAIVDRWLAESVIRDRIDLRNLTARHVRQLCPDERFADQPAIAKCSGVLVAPDLVLTAAHCVDAQRDCEDLVYVSSFENDAEGRWQGLQPELIRTCQQIERVEAEGVVGTARDAALVHLDSRFEVPARWFQTRADPPRIAEPVVAIGHPAGLPLKIDAGGSILSTPARQERYATATIDSFAGSSGSAVFDAHAALLAIVTGGRPDYVYDRAGDCLRSVQVPTAGNGGERILPALTAFDELCRYGSPAACERLQAADAVAPPAAQPAAGACRARIVD